VKRALLLIPLSMLPGLAMAHHGVASLGAVGLEGPGAPVETTVSSTLPAGDTLAYLKLDYASFKTYTAARDDEQDYNAFWMYGAGYGFTSWFTGYAFLPFSSKVKEDNSFNTTGWGDVVLTGTVGFKYDDGFRLMPESESLDDWYDWHFTGFFGMTLPTGDADIRDSGGNIDPGQSLGFGEPSFMLGISTTRLLSDEDTINADISWIGFQEYTYDDGTDFQFGDEWRVNLAYVRKLATNPDNLSRWDASIEANWLSLGRDVSNGVGEVATGGDMLYLQPGLRYYVDNLSFALGIKVPVWTDLNEESLQQGAEGKEDYRTIFTASALF